MEWLMKRRKFTREFKVEACKMVIEQRQSIVNTAHNLGIGDSLLTKWVKAYRDDPLGAFPGEGTPQVFGNDQRLRAVEAELKRVKMERDILKKAMAYFVESPK
jgi:transposase